LTSKNCWQSQLHAYLSMFPINEIINLSTNSIQLLLKLVIVLINSLRTKETDLNFN